MTRSTRIAMLGLVLAGGLLAGCEGAKFENPLDINRLLEKLSPPSGTELATMAFSSPDPDVRRKGVVQLAEKDWALKEPYLEGFAMLAGSDPDPTVRAAAVRALGKAGDPKYAKVLVAMLSDESEMVRWDAAEALNRSPSELAPEKLQEVALNDESHDVRAAAVKALRHYGSAEVFATLFDAMAARNFTVRYQAHQALVEMTRMDKGYERADWPAPAELAARAQPVEGQPMHHRWYDPFGLFEPKPDFRPREYDFGERPWWDWLSVTDPQPADEAPEPAGQDSPWWDPFGLTRRAEPVVPASQPSETGE